jgi:glutamate dehydrogenase (NAD(P)+)
VLEGFDGGDLIDGDELLRLDCDVLIPAAIGGVITDLVAPHVTASIILEGANGPTTGAADLILDDKGVLVIPDILANAGGVTVSYFEWVQDLQNYFWSETEIVGRLREIMSRSFAEVMSIATERKVDMRTAALIKGIKRVSDAKLIRGVFP